VVPQAAPPQQQKETATTSSTSQAAPGEQEQDPAYKYSDGVNQFLGNFLPSNKAARDELDVDFAAPKLTGLSIDELAALVEKGLSRTQWFVTGQVDAQLFSDTFAFKDESVATTGIKAYATGVRKLFDQVSTVVYCDQGSVLLFLLVLQTYHNHEQPVCCMRTRLTSSRFPAAAPHSSSTA
jgi:hypothetical protein